MWLGSLDIRIQLTASLFVYVYIILCLADVLSIPLSLYRKDGRAAALIAALPFLLIGLSCEISIRPRVYILGVLW